jgi:hypothetical protein
MIFKTNIKGESFYSRRKKELYRFFYTFPFFIGLISFLFVLGAKSKLHLYFAIFLLFILTMLVFFAIFSIMKNLNNIICEININDRIVKIKSYSILFLKSKELTINKDEVKLISKKFRINKKDEEQGWEIKTPNYNFSLIKDFFNPNLMNNLSS